MSKSSKMFTRSLKKRGYRILPWTDKNINKVVEDTTGKLILLLPRNYYLNCHNIQQFLYDNFYRAFLDVYPEMDSLVHMLQDDVSSIMRQIIIKAWEHARMSLDAIQETISSPEFRNITNNLFKMGEILEDIEKHHETDENGNIILDERWDELHKQCMFAKEALDPITDAQERIEQDQI